MALELNGTTGVSAVQAGAVESSDLPAGSVIQVVQGTTTTQIATTSTSYIDTTLSVSITPANTANKILVLVNHSDIRRKDAGMGLRLMRNGSEIVEFGTNLGWGADPQPDRHVGTPSTAYLDSPNTTSSVTYSTQTKVSIGNDLVVVQADNDPSFITLMEIAG